MDKPTQNEIVPIKNYAQNLIIRTDIDNQDASEKLKAVKSLKKRINEHYDPAIKKANEAVKAMRAAKKEFAKPLDEAEKFIKKEMINYQYKIEEETRKKQTELEAVARREEKKKKEALEKRAEKWKEKGNDQKAEMLMKEAEITHVMSPVIVPVKTKIDGVHTMEVWKYLVKNIAEVPREYLIINDKAMSQITKATKGSLKIAGIEFYSEKIISARSL